MRATTLEWERFTTGNTHTAWVICRQVEDNAPSLGIDLRQAKVAVVGATGDIGSAVCRWLAQRTGVAELLLVARRPQPLADLQADLGGGRILAPRGGPARGRCGGVGGQPAPGLHHRPRAAHAAPA